jgi:hypothetical protein
MIQLKNKLLLLLTLTQSISLSCFPQSVYTSDGVYLGEKPLIVNECAQGAGGETVDIYGIKVDAIKYCDCLIENVFMKTTYEEIDYAMRNGGIDQFVNSK